jgi:hypothetical protein
MSVFVKTVMAIRYVTPLREGSSLPAVVEADDGELYVVKFSGAGQGPKALIAELVAGAIGQALGLLVPKLAFVVLCPALGPSEPDPEIRDLLNASVGLNLGLRFLPNAFAYNPLLEPPPTSELASAIVWFDAFVTNVDRTPRNTNILVWNKSLWLIDHGAALYFHHDWRDYLERSRSSFEHVKDHVLLPFAAALPEADRTCKARLAPGTIGAIASLIPDAWLDRGPFETKADQRQAYVDYLLSRLEVSAIFVDEARHARSLRV